MSSWSKALGDLVFPDVCPTSYDRVSGLPAVRTLLLSKRSRGTAAKTEYGQDKRNKRISKFVSHHGFPFPFSRAEHPQAFGRRAGVRGMLSANCHLTKKHPRPNGDVRVSRVFDPGAIAKLFTTSGA